MSRFSSSQRRVFSWSRGQYGCSRRGKADSITGSASEGGTTTAVGVAVVLCGKACTEQTPLSRQERTPPSFVPGVRRCVSPHSHSAPQLTAVGTDLLHSLPQGAENPPFMTG